MLLRSIRRYYVVGRLKTLVQFFPFESHFSRRVHLPRLPVDGPDPVETHRGRPRPLLRNLCRLGRLQRHLGDA
jgi:hypothetical protein